MDSPPFTLLDLPLDVQVRFAWMLGHGEHLSCLSNTCHAFKQLCNNRILWKLFYITDWGQCATEPDNWRKEFTRRFLTRVLETQQFNKNPSIIPGLLDTQFSATFTKERYILDLIQDSNVTRESRGIYLCRSDKMATKVRAEYFNTFDFHGKTVLHVLAILLFFVQLPAQASVLSVFVQPLADRYLICNPDSVFKNRDAVEILAFGILMLNTDLHNSAVKDKMTLAQFIHNLAGINGDEDLPHAMLVDIYRGIKAKPLLFNQENQANNKGLWARVKNWIG